LRFVLAGDPLAVVPDVRHSGGGRGASVHPRKSCVARAAQSGAFSRAFKREVRANPEELVSWAIGQYERRFDGLLIAAARSGHAALGTERVREAIESSRARLLIVASDSEAKRGDVMAAARRIGGSCLVRGEKTQLGRLFGRDEIAVVAVTDSALSSALLEAARHVAELAEAS
jgi:predicted RNA-binding protein YlxR (DUF448 family)/ribosomal protein L7Ae-like RNA K-turn-binding protein